MRPDDETQVTEEHLMDEIAANFRANAETYDLDSSPEASKDAKQKPSLVS